MTLYSMQWLVVRYAQQNMEQIIEAIRIAKQEGLSVSLDLASFEVWMQLNYIDSSSKHSLILVWLSTCRWFGAIGWSLLLFWRPETLIFVLPMRMKLGSLLGDSLYHDSKF
jgi:hypothetical protein